MLKSSLREFSLSQIVPGIVRSPPCLHSEAPVQSRTFRTYDPELIAIELKGWKKS